MHSRPGHRKIIALTLAAAAAVLFAAARTLADEKTENGVVLEFWKGHFDRNAGPFHEWDKDKEIPGICARCHGAQSLPEYLAAGKTGPAPHAKNGFACTNCHADMLTYERHKVGTVNFASGISVETGNNDANL